MNIFRHRLAAVALTVFSLVGIPVVMSSCGTDATNDFYGYLPPSEKNVSSVSVRESGKSEPFTLKAAAGEMLIVYFGYTNCPDMCPTTMVAVRNAKQKIGDLATRVDLAMITVDPERDTENILPRYLSSFSNKFHALVPDSDAQLRNAESAFQTTSSVTKTNGEIKVTHGGSAYVVDDTGKVVVEFPFGMDAKSMAHDLQILLTERETKQ